jgi:tetratricopeptide (TPR) repeat protein
MSILRCLAGVLFGLAISAAAWGGALKKPDRTPVESTPEQQRRIQEGIRLHDGGKFNEAIALYREVLRENPDNLSALYELAYSQAENKDLTGSLETARLGARYRSDILAWFYMQMGNCLDQLGRSKESIKVYEQGLKLMPRNAMLYYNMAISYSSLGKTEKARDCLKHSLELNPNHASSHLALGTLYNKGGYRIPAILALMRFLGLEPKSDRAANARRILLEELQGSVKVGAQDQINILMNMDAKKDEGDFTTLDLILNMAVAGMYLEDKKELGQVRKLVGCIESFLGMMGESGQKDKKPGFVARYYMPYFKFLSEKGLAETYAYLILEGSGNEEIAAWLKENSAKVYEFQLLNEDYRWSVDPD